MAGSDTLTGSWTGRFDYDSVAYGTPVSFDAVLTELGSILHGEVVEPNTFRKDAGDALLAVLSGTRDGTSVTFVKTYTDFDDADHPRYEGQVNATATRITGRWHFPTKPDVKGTFLLARTTQAAARKTKRAAVSMPLEDVLSEN